MVNKTRNSVYNSITSLLLTIVNGLCNLIVTRELISVYGSDFNGLNSTATQFINILLIIEGGFALAANVALFEPLKENKTDRIGSIFSAVSKRFRFIGLIFCLVGLLGSFVLSFIIKTSVPYELCFCIFSMLIISTGFGLFYSTRYKVLLQSDQTEYVINIVSIVTYLLSYGLMYLAILNRWHIILLRLIVFVFAILNSLIIGVFCKKKYPYLNDKHYLPDYSSIKGTKDVFVQKIVGVIYYAAPILIIASVANTTVASIYAVYNMVITLIRSAENSIINAPRMSLGRLIAEKGEESEDFRKVYNQYECCTFVSISALISVTSVMIMPFIKIYSSSFVDASYYNWFFAIALILTCYIECIHIPAGNLLNMSGRFKQGKQIQLIGGAVLVLSMIVGALFYNINGIIISVLFTAIVLAVLEIGYVRKSIIKKDFGSFIKNLGVNVLSVILVVVVELMIPIDANSIGTFFVFSFLFLIINSCFLSIVNLVFNRTIFVETCRRFIGLIKKRSFQRKQ